MSQWSWEESYWKETWTEPWLWKERDEGAEGDEELFQKLILKARNPWLTPTESCTSDETEEEEVKQLSAPPSLGYFHRRSDDTRSESCFKRVQTGVTGKAESHLHPRYKQMKDVSRFQGIIAKQASDGLRDQTRLSIPSWNAGLRRGNVAGCHHVIQITDIAAEYFHIHQGADQLVKFNKIPSNLVVCRPKDCTQS